MSDSLALDKMADIWSIGVTDHPIPLSAGSNITRKCDFYVKLNEKKGQKMPSKKYQMTISEMTQVFAIPRDIAIRVVEKRTFREYKIAKPKHKSIEHLLDLQKVISEVESRRYIMLDNLVDLLIPSYDFSYRTFEDLRSELVYQLKELCPSILERVIIRRAKTRGISPKKVVVTSKRIPHKKFSSIDVNRYAERVYVKSPSSEILLEKFGKPVFKYAGWVTDYFSIVQSTIYYGPRFLQLSKSNQMEVVRWAIYRFFLNHLDKPSLLREIFNIQTKELMLSKD